MTSFAGRWVVSRPGDIWSPRTFAPAGAPGVGMTSTAMSWWADVVGMAAFGRRRRLGAGGSATLRGSLSVDTLCLHGGRLPCYDNRKHGPERAGLERERDLRGGVNAECECPRWRVCDVLRSCGKRIATNCLESQSQRWRRRRWKILPTRWAQYQGREHSSGCRRGGRREVKWGSKGPKRWGTSGYSLAESGMKEEQRVMNLRHGAAGR